MCLCTGMASWQLAVLSAGQSVGPLTLTLRWEQRGSQGESWHQVATGTGKTANCHGRDAPARGKGWMRVREMGQGGQRPGELPACTHSHGGKEQRLCLLFLAMTLSAGSGSSYHSRCLGLSCKVPGSCQLFWLTEQKMLPVAFAGSAFFPVLPQKWLAGEKDCLLDLISLTPAAGHWVCKHQFVRFSSSSCLWGSNL